ncbi:hypothetical protein STAFG_3509 [Streptomyces afghaniensis 772]|uniref:Uncharacterized protein n=1 Tax=Streptomyces afghaniensis 772 TaxID=1283301 RepID=S4MIR2_9ACTN|nr:hypothetical protein STAFG_3509 [Streptomyces afghaniensis 772]
MTPVPVFTGVGVSRWGVRAYGSSRSPWVLSQGLSVTAGVRPGGRRVRRVAKDRANMAM